MRALFKKGLERVILLCFFSMLFFSIPAYAENDSISRGVAEYQDESFEEAAVTLEKARKTAPQDSRLLYYLGLSYKSMLDFDKARTFLQQAHKRAPENGEINYHLGEVLYDLGDYKAAEAALKQTISSGVKAGRASYFLGLLRYKTGRPAEAVAAFSHAVQLDASLKKKALYSMGLAQSRMGDRQAALQSFRQVMDVAPDSYEAVQAKEAIETEPESEHNFQIGVVLSEQYDGNVLLAPSSPTAGVLVTRQHDTSSAASLNASYSRQVNNDWGYSASYGYYQNLHSKLTFFDVQSNHVDVTPYMKMRNGTGFLRLSGDFFSVDYRRYLASFSAMPGYIVEYGNHQEGMLQLGYARKVYFQPTTIQGENRNANNLSFGYTHSLLPGYSGTFLGGMLKNEGSRLDVSYAFDVEKASGANWGYFGHHFKASLIEPLLNNFWFTLSADHYRQDYRHKHVSFGIKRKDFLTILAPTLEWRFNDHINVKVEGSFTRAKSNISVFDYRRNVVTGSLSGVF